MLHDNANDHLLTRMEGILSNTKITNWIDIIGFLNNSDIIAPSVEKVSLKDFSVNIKRGIAFITFDYGIDGVSIEIEKYANCFEKLFENTNEENTHLHFIGGDFYDKADTVLKPYWRRFKINGMNGWSKWDDGKWFSKLFYEDMPENSKVSDDMAKEIWSQANKFALQLADYLIKNDISLLIPVNICSNPGNPAIALAVVIVSEALGLHVISSNHDYYWEGGKADRTPNEAIGPRDHFFKNVKNKPFFSFLNNIFPWNGKRWIQVNINEPQSKALIEKFDFSINQVYEIGSCISNEFLRDYSLHEVLSARLRMTYILSDGHPIIKPVPVKQHLSNLSSWMKNQKPIVCSNSANLELNPVEKGTIYCLQPTRVIARKRIYKDLELLTSLLNYEKMAKAFETGEIEQLVLHISGPVPIEHQSDLEDILNAYAKLCSSVPKQIADHVFIAFSVGTENHPSLLNNGLDPLCIEDIYKLADIILFPSETEGRGLPIIESGACGIPIVCSRYYPEEVFDGVVGCNLPYNEQIKYILFPEDSTDDNEALEEISDILLTTEAHHLYVQHNKSAVSKRYGVEMLVKKFGSFIEILNKI